MPCSPTSSSRTGVENIAILARQDAYGETLAKEVKKNVEAAGSKVAASVLYDEKNGPGDSQITEIADAKADAVVLIAFDETTTIIPKLIQAGARPEGRCDVLRRRQHVGLQHEPAPSSFPRDR